MGERWTLKENYIEANTKSRIVVVEKCLLKEISQGHIMFVKDVAKKSHYTKKQIMIKCLDNRCFL